MTDATAGRECMCGNACSYFVIRCDRCREWYYISCHKLTEEAIKRLKDFYCRPCKSKDPKLQNTLKERPTDKGATYERRVCDINNHHAIHRFRGKQDPVRCICKPQCKTFCIGCEECKRWCHNECVSYTKEKADSVTKYYCPPCMERNPQLRILGKKPRSSSIKLRQAEGSRKRAATSPEDSSAADATLFGAMSTSTAEQSRAAYPKRKKSAANCTPRPAPNVDVDNVQGELAITIDDTLNCRIASPSSTTAQNTARSSTTPNATFTAASITDATGAVADTALAGTSGTSAARQSKKKQCICGSPCAYHVVKCDHCRAWSYASCHGLTKRALNLLKSFYCASCRRADPTLTNTQKQRPADKGVTYEHRLCERGNYHGTHRYRGKEEPLRCDHVAPCKDLAIGCHKCKRWCHYECVSLTNEMGGKIAKFYCPPCVEEDPRLLIAYCNSESLDTSSKQRQPVNSKRAAASTHPTGALAQTPGGCPAKKGKDARKRKRIIGSRLSSPTPADVTAGVDNAPEERDNTHEASVDGDNEVLHVKEEAEPDTRPGALESMLLQARVRAIEGQLREKDAELEKTKADNKRLLKERQRLEAELAKSKADYKQLSEDHKKSEDALKRTLAEKDSELADLRRQRPSTFASITHDAARIQELERQLQLRDTCIARMTLAANGLAQ